MPEFAFAVRLNCEPEFAALGRRANAVLLHHDVGAALDIEVIALSFDERQDLVRGRVSELVRGFHLKDVSRNGR